MKYYTKMYPDIVRATINEHRLELLHFIEANEGYGPEKVLTAYIKNRIV